VVGEIPVNAATVRYVDNSACRHRGENPDDAGHTGECQGPVPVLMMFGGFGGTGFPRRPENLPPHLEMVSAAVPSPILLDRATDRRRLGLRDISRAASRRQRRWTDEGHHRPRQQRPAAQADDWG